MSITSDPMHANKAPKRKYLERRKSCAYHAPLPNFLHISHKFQKGYQDHHSYEFPIRSTAPKRITNNT